MLPFDGEASVPKATKLLPDNRVVHFWDGAQTLGKAYKPILEIDQTAWDVYLLYPPDAEWKEQPPKPVYWMHQLGVEKGQPLDGEILAGEVKKLLETDKK